MNDEQEHIEDRLGFGQLTPLLLLLPVLALAESYVHHTEAHKRRQEVGRALRGVRVGGQLAVGAAALNEHC